MNIVAALIISAESHRLWHFQLRANFCAQSEFEWWIHMEMTIASSIIINISFRRKLRWWKNPNLLINLFHLINSIYIAQHRDMLSIHGIYCLGIKILWCDVWKFYSIFKETLATRRYLQSLLSIFWMLHFYVQASVLFHLIPMNMLDGSFNTLQWIHSFSTLASIQLSVPHQSARDSFSLSFCALSTHSPPSSLIVKRKLCEEEMRSKLKRKERFTYIMGEEIFWEILKWNIQSSILHAPLPFSHNWRCAALSCALKVRRRCCCLLHRQAREYMNMCREVLEIFSFQLHSHRFTSLSMDFLIFLICSGSVHASGDEM